jgi:hypothetical protein
MADRPTSGTPAPLSHRLPNQVRGSPTLEDRAALLLGESLISLAQAARLFPPNRQGKPVHVTTLQRWVLDGIRGVHLEAARAGGRWVTSREAVARFLAALTAGHLSQPAAVTRPDGSAEQRRHERVEEQLSKLGVV